MFSGECTKCTRGVTEAWSGRIELETEAADAVRMPASVTMHSMQDVGDICNAKVIMWALRSITSSVRSAAALYTVRALRGVSECVV